MGIIRKLTMITKANVHDWLDSLEDPIAILNEHSREMKQELENTQKALSRQLFTENKLKKLMLETKQLVEKRTRQAKPAIELGEETIVKMAIEDKLILESQLNLYEQQYETIREQTHILKEQLKEFKKVMIDLQQKKMLLASRAKKATFEHETGSKKDDQFSRGFINISTF